MALLFSELSHEAVTSLLPALLASMGVALLFGTSIGLVSRLRPIHRWSVLNRASGVILVGFGFYLL